MATLAEGGDHCITSHRSLAKRVDDIRGADTHHRQDEGATDP